MSTVNLTFITNINLTHKDELFIMFHLLVYINLGDWTYNFYSRKKGLIEGRKTDGLNTITVALER